MNQNTKRLLSFILALLMVFAALPAMTVIESFAEGTVYETDDFLTLVAYLASDSAMTIRLTGDISIDEDFEGQLVGFQVNGNKTLDLNGYQLDVEDRFNGRRGTSFYIDNEETLFIVNGSLTVVDAPAGGGGIRFHAYAWGQAKTIAGTGDYDRRDVRNVFEVQTGASLTINGGSITSGRCKTQYITGGKLDKGYYYPVTSIADTFNANATFVIAGSPVVLQKGSHFIMNGGELSARSFRGNDACIKIASLSGTEEHNPTTVIINDGYLHGKAGANIFRGVSYNPEVLDVKIYSGEFDLSKETYVRNNDDPQNSTFSDSEVFYGSYGKANISPDWIVNLAKRPRGVLVFIDGDCCANLDEILSTGETETTDEGEVYIAEADVKVKPITYSTNTTVSFANDRTELCLGETTTLTAGCTEYFDSAIVGNLNEALDGNGSWSYVGHFFHTVWTFTDRSYKSSIGDFSEYHTYTVEESGTTLDFSRISELCPELWTLLQEGGGFHVKAKVAEHYAGAHEYKLLTETEYQFFFISEHLWENVPGTDTATCLNGGHVLQECARCHKQQTVSTQALGHICDEEKWFPHNYNGNTSYHKHICLRCGDTVSGSLVEHNFTETVVSTPSCTKAGQKDLFCEDCGFTKRVYYGEALGHTYRNNGNIYDWQHNSNGHWKTCERCGAASAVENHVDEDSNKVCDLCGESLPYFKLTTDGAPSWHATLKAEGSVQTIDFETFKNYCKQVYDKQETGGTALYIAELRLSNYINDFRTWLDGIDPSGGILAKFNQLVTDYTTNYDRSVADNLNFGCSYTWNYSNYENFSTDIHRIYENGVNGTQLGKQSRLELFVKPISTSSYAISYPYTQDTWIRASFTVSVRNSVTKNSMIGAGFYSINSDVLKIPAMSSGSTAPTCTECGKYPHYICPCCGKLWAFMDEDGPFTTDCGFDGINREFLDIVYEEHLFNENSAPYGHRFDPACGDVCTRCGWHDESYKHEAESNECFYVNSSSHAKRCRYCGEDIVDIEGHSFIYEVTEEATCEATGKMRLICADCGYTDSIITIPKTGHNMVLNADQSVNTGCTNDGVYVLCCSNCGYTETITESATGHSMTEIPYQAQHCYQDGSIHCFYCSSCGKYFLDAQGNNEIPEANAIIAQDGVSHVFNNDVWMSDSRSRWHECLYCDARKDEEFFFLQGDVNGDGYVTITDVTELLNVLSGSTTADDVICDVNSDRRISIEDVTELLNILSNS